MLAPTYGLATLYVPPAGVPDNAIELPVHPLTFPAVTVGKEFTVIDFEEDVPVQFALVPKTETVPDDAPVVKLTVIAFVFAPVVMDAPAGNDHVYDVAFVRAVMLKVTPVLPAHNDDTLVIEPAAAT